MNEELSLAVFARGPSLCQGFNPEAAAVLQRTTFWRNGHVELTILFNYRRSFFLYAFGITSKPLQRHYSRNTSHSGVS